MLVQTTRFGQIEAQQEQVLVFPQGLIGFEASRHGWSFPIRITVMWPGCSRCRRCRLRCRWSAHGSLRPSIALRFRVGS